MFVVGIGLRGEVNADDGVGACRRMLEMADATLRILRLDDPMFGCLVLRSRLSGNLCKLEFVRAVSCEDTCVCWLFSRGCMHVV